MKGGIFLKTNLFLVIKYWRAHKAQLVSVIFSAAFLAAVVLLAGLTERTELRRAYELYQYEYGKQSHTYCDLPDEAYAEMRADERVERIGQVLAFGKLGSGSNEYSCGAYLDDEAQTLENLYLLAGRMPEGSGEIAIYEHVASDLLFSTDANECIGKKLSLRKYEINATDEEKSSSPEKEYTVVGVIRYTEARERDYLPYYCEKTPSLPSIYLHKSDCGAAAESSHIYTLVFVRGEEEYRIDDPDNTDEFILHYYEKYGVTSNYCDRSGTAKTLRRVMISDTQSVNTVFQSQMSIVIRYFSVLAVIISGISLFGVLGTVMKRRFLSLAPVREIGCSKRRISAIIGAEAALLLALGTALGIIVGTAFYVMILFVQYNFLGLSPLSAFRCEWAVLQVTPDPFVTAIICSAAVFTLGYAAFLIQRKFFGKRRLSAKGKVRPLSKIKSVICGLPFSNIMQMLAAALVLASCVLCWAFFTTEGKGDSMYFFKDSDNSEEKFYTYGYTNMKENNVDICIWAKSAGNGSISVINDDGISGDALTAIESLPETGQVYGFSNNTALCVYYDKESEVPKKIKERWVGELKDNASPVFKKDERNYYTSWLTSANETCMDWLKKYVREGEIGSRENGLTLIVYGEDRMKPVPYSVGDTVNIFAADVRALSGEQLNDPDLAFDFPISDRQAVIEAVTFIPPDAKFDDPILYQGFRSALFAAPHDTVKNLGTFRYSFDKTYIRFDKNADFNGAVSKIRGLLDSSMKVNLRTIKQCDEEYLQNRIQRGASIILLFVSLILMAAAGYLGMISTRLENSTKNAAIMRALGMSRRSWNIAFLVRNILNSVCACVLGAGLVYGVQTLLSAKYTECMELTGWEETFAVTVQPSTMDALKEAYAICSAYLLNSEMQNAPVIIPIILVGLALIIASAAMTAALLHKKNKSEKLSELIAGKE